MLKNDVFAIIHQLGPPTFLVTFTSDESTWLLYYNVYVTNNQMDLTFPLIN
jgi:hypothetical protein